VLVVADTSVMLNLCRVSHEHLLPALFNEVQIPSAVRTEFDRLTQNHPRFRGLVLPAWVKVVAVICVPPEIQRCPDLDAGETEALALALQIHADAVLIDEAAARRAALQLRLPFIGVAGILLRAKSAGLIPAVRPVLDQLRSEASFWLTSVFEAHVLRLAGETP
jgi:uncharacterized protein